MKQYDMIKKSFVKLNRLLIYRNVLQDPILNEIIKLIGDLNKFIKEEHYNRYYNLCSQLLQEAEKEKYQGDLLQNYLLKLIYTDNNPFTIASENGMEAINSSLYGAALHDIKILKEVFKYTLSDIGVIIGVGEISFISHYSPENKNELKLKNYQKLKFSFSKDTAEATLNLLIEQYNKYGSGLLFEFKAFKWDSFTGLTGIKDPDPIIFEDLIGYNNQKKKLIKNTESFLKGNTANNILLFGDSGTGKSSSVKALVNMYAEAGLRLVEIYKDHLKDLPEIITTLKDRGLYFIIFLDDLSFEDFETEYKYLKAVIEGGVEGRADNILFYATSNRRHIVKEKWDERNQLAEVHENDALQEKLSLAERFGITITYLAPDQEKYVEIVQGLAEKNNLNISRNELIKEAKQWELWHNGRSGRSAQQFINYLLSENTSKKDEFFDRNS
ncbi:MAG: ATP-binding protein [Halothermotrichaceae bacterium]